MTVEVFAADEQADHPVDTLRWVKLAEAVLEEEGIHGDAELSMLFVDEQSIADLNKRFLGKDGPTDVLAFPIDEEPSESGRSPDSGGSGPGFTGELEEAPSLLGDVVICPAVAFRNAPEHAGTYDDEVALLVVHGVLHLLGLDHMDDEEAEEMEARERELLAKHHGGALPASTTGAGPDPATAAGAAHDPAAAAGAAHDPAAAALDAGRDTATPPGPTAAGGDDGADAASDGTGGVP